LEPVLAGLAPLLRFGRFGFISALTTPLMRTIFEASVALSLPEQPRKPRDIHRDAARSKKAPASAGAV
jgi:hypothetical protein